MINMTRGEIQKLQENLKTMEDGRKKKKIVKRVHKAELKWVKGWMRCAKRHHDSCCSLGFVVSDKTANWLRSHKIQFHTLCNSFALESKVTEIILKDFNSKCKR